VLLALAAGRHGSAATLGPNAFLYDGHAVALQGTGETVPRIDAWWNPRQSRDNPHVLAPGFHVSFFGRGSGCTTEASNGPVARVPTDLAALTKALTGLPYNAEHNDLSFAPTADAASCPGGAHLPPGPAFVLVREQPPLGIGLFTHAGDGGRIPGPHFWQQFSAGGQNGAGANAAIEGSFIAWRFDWRQGRGMLPWAEAGMRNGTMPRVVITSSQSVAAAAVAASPRGVRPAQVKQQYAASFINPVCQEKVKDKRVCQVQYLFHTALMRGGNVVWREQSWANHAQLLFDPAQGGMPIFYGPLKADGQVTAYGATPLWRSLGEATRHAPFHDVNFTAEISFREFLNGLRAIAGRVLAMPAERVDARRLAALFGPAWADPAGWRLLDVNVGQEVHDEDVRQEAYIGGSVTRLEVRAGTMPLH
jgi:hypothetical protein